MLRKPLKNTFFFLFFLQLFLSSCAWNHKKHFDEHIVEDLTKAFDLKGENLKKFKEVEIHSPTTRRRDKVKKKVSKVQKIKKIKFKKKLVKKNIFPENYPEQFKEYDKKSKKVWDQYHPLYRPGEKFVFKLSYLGVTAGHISMEVLPQVKLGQKMAYHYRAKLTSADFYKYIYSLEDTVQSFVDVDLYRPIKYSLQQRESGQKVDDLQLFDHEKMETKLWYQREKKGRFTKKQKTMMIPRYFQDSFSALFFTRGLPLKKGDIYEFPVVTRGKVWILKMEVAKFETIEVLDKPVKAIKIKAATRFPGVLKKKGDIVFWYSQGPSHKLLRFRAKIKIGQVAGDLIHYFNPW